MGEPLATVEEFKTYKSISPSNISEDELIEQLLQSTSDYIKEYCGRTFNDYVYDEKIEYHDGSMDSRVYVKEFPIIDIKVEFSNDGGQTYVLGTEFSDYYKGGDYIDSGTTLPLYNPTISHRAILIQYTAGFDELPADLVLACMDLTEYFRKNEYNPKSSHGSEMVERGNNDYVSTKLPSHILRVLSNYREMI